MVSKRAHALHVCFHAMGFVERGLLASWKEQTWLESEEGESSVVLQSMFNVERLTTKR